MRTVEQIRAEIELVEKEQWREELADDSFYINGKSKEYDKRLYELKKELKQAEQN